MGAVTSKLFVKSVNEAYLMPHYLKPSALPQTLLTVSGMLRLIMTETGEPPEMVDNEVPLTKVSVNGTVNCVGSKDD